MRDSFYASWQADYDVAIGKGGKVNDAFGVLGRFGGLAIWIEVHDEPGRDGIIFYSPYLNQSPGDGEHVECYPDGGNRWRDDQGRFCEPCGCDLCSFELDSEAWIDSMAGATDWGEWDWGDGSESILTH